MDSFSSYFQQPSFDFQTLLKNNDISIDVQRHLQRTYASLFAAVVSACVGVIFYLRTHVNHTLTFIGVIAFMFLLLGDRNREPRQRFAFLIGLGFCKGAAIGSLVEVGLAVDPTIVVSALLATSAMFGAFSAIALFSKRRSFLYLGGILSSLLGYMCIASLLNIFIRVPYLFDTSIYLGLVVFSGYVVVDTQMIIEKADRGERDHLKHAMELFIDLVAVFVRVLIILLKNQEKKRGGERRDTNRRNVYRR